MTLLDTDVAIDILRNHAPAIAWLQGLGSAILGLPGLVVMELLQGCQDKTEQQKVEQFCRPFVLFWPSKTDCQNALQDFWCKRFAGHLQCQTLQRYQWAENHSALLMVDHCGFQSEGSHTLARGHYLLQASLKNLTQLPYMMPSMAGSL
jgi:hypothetical protein